MAESAVIAGVMIMLTLGGSVVTTMIPPSFVPLQDPAKVPTQHDASALAAYYNSTLTQIGRSNFSNASFLLMTFHFVNISPSVNGTAQAANADLAGVNTSAALATTLLDQASLDVSNNELLNATLLTSEACLAARDANGSLTDFQGPQTSRLTTEGVPTGQYSKGLNLASAEVASLLESCNTPNNGALPVLIIGSPQTAVETGGSLGLVGNMTVSGVGIPGQEVLLFANGTYFGQLETGSSGSISGTLSIPFLYAHTVVIVALSSPNDTQMILGSRSNPLFLKLLFDGTAISIGDPPAVLPTFKFSVHGNLTTDSGSGLPQAPVRIAFLGESKMVQTDEHGGFGTTLVVPANTTDGIYDVSASFAPQGTFGPSFNFTSIQVIHLPLALSLDAPSTSFAGFSARLVGEARVNGSAAADVAIRASSPWGSVTAKTNSTGGFTVELPISPVEFSFSKDVTVSGSAPRPYVSSATIVKSIGLFNILLVLLPVAAVGMIGFEADRLGAFDGLRRRSRKQATRLEEPLIAPELAMGSSTAPGSPELLQIFHHAIVLAQDRLSVRFRASQTIREVIAEVHAHESGSSIPIFIEIMLVVEDFLYAQTFDQRRVEVARRRLAELEGLWK